ncbi:TPA: hypothetical protein QEL30_002416 [Stenotrophomonas maltophilia]|nr:hypothetical protein [Stenotrophomonas maltophilia]
MTYLVVSSDFLAAPAFCEATNIDSCVEGLVAVRRRLDSGDKCILVEHGALDALERNGLYPLVGLIRENSSRRDFHFEYSSNDITRVVNNILASCVEGDISLPEYLAEWENFEVRPELFGFSESRASELNKLVEQVGIFASHKCATVSILHSPIGVDVSRALLKGTLSGVYPDIGISLPEDVSIAAAIISKYSDYESSIDGAKLYEGSLVDGKFNVQAAMRAFEVGVKIRRDRAGLNEIPFTFGAGFLESLLEFQCGPGGRYGNAAYSIICDVVADPHSELSKPFHSDNRAKTQLVRDGKSAWRVHITKSGPGIRFMFWMSDRGIELANVGNKHDLVII